MPLIKDVLKETEHKKKFQRKAYRPWDDEVSTPSIDQKKEEFIKECVSDLAESVEILTPKNLSIVSLPSNGGKQEKAIEDLDLEKCLRDLYGAQRVVFKFLINLQTQEINDICVTQPISTNEIALATKLPTNTIKTVIGRLKSKNLIKTSEWKPGRGGYGRYGFDSSVYSFFLKKFAES